MSDLRPTLFLAQLSNLLAGNIAIVHGVTGSSRTFMGEEGAGVDAARIALARIAHGQSDIALIGGSHNAERKEMLMLYEFDDFNLRDKYAPVWARSGKPGFALGSVGAFLVMESKAPCAGARRQAVCAADQRGGRPGPPQTAGRSDGVVAGAVVEARQARRQRRHHHRRDRSGARTSEERVFAPASRFRDPRLRHRVRPQHGAAVRLGLALAALSISRGALFPPTIPRRWRLKCRNRRPRLW